MKRQRKQQDILVLYDKKYKTSVINVLTCYVLPINNEFSSGIINI